MYPVSENKYILKLLDNRLLYLMSCYYLIKAVSLVNVTT